LSSFFVHLSDNFCMHFHFVFIVFLCSPALSTPSTKYRTFVDLQIYLSLIFLYLYF